MQKLKLSISLLLVFSICLFVTFPCFAASLDYIWSESQETSALPQEEEIEESNSLNLESGSAILIEQTTGKILYAHNIHEKLRPASVTKVMSILLIMEALDSRKNQSNRPSPL